MPEAKFHQKIAWFNFICCLMVIWTHSGNADLLFPGTGEGRTVVAFPVPGHAGNSAGGHSMLYHAVCLPVLPELHDEAAGREIEINVCIRFWFRTCSGIPSTTWRMWRRAGFRDCRRSPTGRIW